MPEMDGVMGEPSVLEVEMLVPQLMLGDEYEGGAP